jgi:hypothetical protein
VPVAATQHGAIVGPARDSGRRAPASILAWTKGVPTAATSHGAVPELARDGERRASENFHAWTEGGCQLPPHRTEPLSDSPMAVGEAH